MNETLTGVALNPLDSAPFRAASPSALLDAIGRIRMLYQSVQGMTLGPPPAGVLTLKETSGPFRFLINVATISLDALNLLSPKVLAQLLALSPGSLIFDTKL